jgi:hypothetical protein
LIFDFSRDLLPKEIGSRLTRRPQQPEAFGNRFDP